MKKKKIILTCSRPANRAVLWWPAMPHLVVLWWWCLAGLVWEEVMPVGGPFPWFLLLNWVHLSQHVLLGQCPAGNMVVRALPGL